MRNCYFYFDESFHTRNITKNSLKDTNYFNSYVSTGLGFEKINKHEIFKHYEKFENKYKSLFTVEELKSDIVKHKNYQYGLASFNNNAIQMYSDFFELLNRYNIIYYISVIDKLEFLLSKCKFKGSYILNTKAVIYSITKAINVYKPQNVIDDIMNKNNQLLNDLIDFFKNQMKINGNIPLKELENNAMNEIIMFLNMIDTTSITFEFNYLPTYLGLQLLTKELNIKSIDLIIDKEGSNKIIRCAKEAGFLNSKQMDSKTSPGIRMSDLFCGFISRMMRAVYEATYNNPDIPYKERHLLPEDWFSVNEEQFYLYKKVARFIKKYMNLYYASFVSIYSDLFVVFIELIYYFDNFDSYGEYKETTIKDHAEKCNNEIIFKVEYEIKRLEREQEFI